MAPIVTAYRYALNTQIDPTCSQGFFPILNEKITGDEVEIDLYHTAAMLSLRGRPRLAVRKQIFLLPPKTQHDRRVIRVFCFHNISEKGTEFVGVCSSIGKKKKTRTKIYNGSKSAPVEFATVNMDLE